MFYINYIMFLLITIKKVLLSLLLLLLLLHVTFSLRFHEQFCVL